MHYFNFEKDLEENGLACIPMCVRYKLDMVGIKLSLKQWNRLTPADRMLFAEIRMKTDNDKIKFEEYLCFLLEGDKEGNILRIPPPRSEQELKMVTFISLNEKLESVPLHITWSQWDSLSVLQQFAISKLIKPGHESKNLWPALTEFGLITVQLNRMPAHEEYH